MAFYQLSRLNEAVKWVPGQARTVLRFAPDGGLVLLHATDEATLTPKEWLTHPLQLGLYGTSVAEESGHPDVPPVLCLRVGQAPAIAAPACIFELGPAALIYEWLNARAMPAELRLVLLRLDAARPGRAVVEASRRLWAPEWATGDVLLRLRLEQQCLRTPTEDAGEVQHIGRVLVTNYGADYLLSGSSFQLAVPGEGMDSLTNPVFERVTAN